MILRRVWVQDLFSYRRRVEIDLRRLDPNHPGAVVLLHGRNGQGKTSFLNSLKLLFGGVTERMRAEAVQGAVLKQNEYLCGRPPQWWGVFHRAARSPGQEHLVGAEWDSAEGVVRVERRWRLGANLQPEDALGELTWTYQSDGRTLRGDEARDRLERVFPPFALPFFFFDGEQIMALAADHGVDRVDQMKRLLNLTPLEALQERLTLVRRAARREALDGVGRAELERVEAELSQLQAERQRVSERQRRQAREAKDLEDEAAALEAALAPYRGKSADADLAKLQGRAEELEKRIAEDARSLAIDLPVRAPWLFNPELLTRALRELNKLVNGDGDEARADALVRVRERLIRELFAVAPNFAKPLDDKQIRFYKERLMRLIDQDAPMADPDQLQISPADRQRVARRMEELAGDHAARQRWVKMVKDHAQRQHELRDLRVQIEAQAVESEDERKLRERLHREHEEVRVRLAAARAELALLTTAAKDLEVKEEAKRREVEAKERQAALTDAADRRAELAERVEKLLKELVPMAFQRRKDELEEGVNKHLRALLTSNTLIDRVVFTERLDHKFVDAAGREIGTASVSAGMKQLYAMAFLWALRSASGHSLPVVIDTPLARLDREHQERLVQDYFPKLGEQVILLPTNSELDAHRYALLHPHVYRQHRLRILASGDETEVTEQEMYPGSRP